jgi:signal transduction histidine kinase
MSQTKKSFFLQQKYQIIYAVVLILLIPVAIIFNTILSIRSFQTNIDINLQRQALSIGSFFETAVFQDVDDYGQLQDKVIAIGQSNPELKNLDVLLPAGDDFTTTASLDVVKLGKISGNINHTIAWHQNEAVAMLASEETERFWEVVMPLHDTEGQKKAMLSLRMSLQTVDGLIKSTLTNSYIILTITVLIVILLLALNTRLFEYAILFRKLKEVDKMKDEFISIASHELRTPITTIKGFLSMILEGDYGQLNPQGRKGLKIMEASVNRLGVLVGDLLNVSRIEQKRLQVKQEKIILSEILQSVVDEFELRVKEKGLAFKTKISKKLPAILADEDKLRQVLINLIGNAVKYTKKGEIELLTKIDDKFVTIMIKDTGLGMSAKERENLFSKFYRIQSDDTRGIVGTGLGLWITKQLVELMGGEIYLDSIKDVGTQFYFTVPIYKNNNKK